MTVMPLSLPAFLYSACGKLAVTIVGLSETTATVMAEALPPCGSAAILVRNGLKVPAIVTAGAEGRLDLALEDCAGARRHMFIGAAGPVQPVMRLAA